MKMSWRTDGMDLKKLFHALLFPPFWITLILSVFSAVGLIYVFIGGYEQSVPAYVLYSVSAYALTVLVLFFVRIFPGKYRNIKAFVYNNPYGKRYFTDPVFKATVSLYCSLSINIVYSAMNLLLGALQGSFWFVILAFYYAVLSVMRFLLVRYVKRNTVGLNLLSELSRARICAYILLLVNFSLTGGVLMMMYTERGHDYPGIMIYVAAVYAFYITASAIKNIIKYRKYNSPVLSVAKIISLASALVSVLSLEDALLLRFGTENSEQFSRLMIALTGAGISITVVSLSVIFIVKATKEINRMKRS